MKTLTGKDKEYGFFFCYKDRQKTEKEFELFCNVANEADDNPCTFYLAAAQWSNKRFYPFMIAMILPAEYEHEISGWLTKHKIFFGDTVEGTRNTLDFYANAKPLFKIKMFPKVI
jgi:hypothetical protein